MPYCTECGAEVAADSSYCTSCGAAVSVGHAQQTASESAEPARSGTAADEEADAESGSGIPTRTVLVIAVLLAVAAVAAAGGYVFVLNQPSPAGVDQVPQGVDMIAHGDVAAILSDPGFRRLVNASLASQSELPTYDGPEDFDEALADAERESGLDPRAVESMTAFSRYDERAEGVGEYSAVIVHASWTEDDVVDAIESEEPYELVEREYEGATVYEPDTETGTSWVGVLAEDAYVFGTEAAVKDTIDVRNGDAEPVAGELRQLYSDLRSGPAKFVFAVPSERVPEQGFQQGGAGIDTGPLRKIEYVGGVYYREEGTVGTTVVLDVQDTDAARDVNDVLDGGISLARGMAQDEEFKDALRDVDVAREGNRVTITVEKSIDSLEELITRAYDQRLQ